MTTSRRGRPSGRRGGFSRGPRRATEWYESNIDLTIASGGQTTDTLSGNIPDDDKKGLTVVRFLINMTAVLITAGTGGHLYLGIAQITADALAAVALPDADVATEKVGWLWRASRVVATDSVNDSTQFARFEVDLRSKRRLRGEDMDLVLIANLPSSSASINIDGWVRMLALKS